MDGAVGSTLAAWTIGAAYDSTDDESDVARPRSRAAVAVRKMSPDDRKKYKHDLYLKNQAKQQALFLKDYYWLACDDAKGLHCAECLKQPVGLRAGDKLSTGYGMDADAAPHPVPSELKLTEHKAFAAHKANVRRNKARRAASCLAPPHRDSTPSQLHAATLHPPHSHTHT